MTDSKKTKSRKKSLKEIQAYLEQFERDDMLDDSRTRDHWVSRSRTFL